MTTHPLPVESNPALPPRPSFLKTLQLGAKAGLRLMLFMSIPLSVTALMITLIPSVLAFGAGHGFALQPWTITGFILFFVLEACGALGGIFVALIAFPILKQRRKLGWEPWRIAGQLGWFSRKQLARIEKSKAAYSSENPPVRSRWVVGIALISALIFSGILITYGAGIFVVKRVNRQLAEAMAEADRDDPAWRFKDMVASLKQVPDDENSAIVVAKVLTLLPANWPAAAPNEPGRPKPPPTEFMTALEGLKTADDNRQLDKPTADIFRNELDQHSKAIELARTLANYRRGSHRLEWPPNLFLTPLTETQNTRNIARLLQPFAAIQAQDGDIDGSLETCRAILGSARSIGDEPNIVSGLVRIAIGSIAMQVARRTLAQGEASEPALARLQAEILDELAEPILVNTIKAERAINDEMIRRVRDAEIPISALSGKPDLNPPGPIAPWAVLWFDNQRAIGLKWHNERADIAKRPAHERRPLLKAWNDELQRVKKSRIETMLSFFPLLLLPALDAAETAQTRYEASLGSTAILLAAERQRMKTGRWPTSVAEIDPAILKNPPNDPYNGQPFLIETRDHQFLVYSVGPNLKDENGKHGFKNTDPDDVGTGAWDVPFRKQPAPPPIEQKGEGKEIDEKPKDLTEKRDTPG